MIGTILFGSRLCRERRPGPGHLRVQADPTRIGFVRGRKKKYLPDSEETEQDGEGIRILEESIQAKPNDEDLYLLLAEVFEKENQLERALATLKRGLEKKQNGGRNSFQSESSTIKWESSIRCRRDEGSAPAQPEPCPMPSTISAILFPSGGIRLEEALKLSRKAMELKPIWGTSR